MGEKTRADTYKKLLAAVLALHVVCLMSSVLLFSLFMDFRIRLTSNLIFWFFYPFSSCVFLLEIVLLTWGLAYVTKTGQVKHQKANIFWGFFFVAAYVVELGLSTFTKLEPTYGPLVIPFDNGTQIHWFTREKTPTLVEVRGATGWDQSTIYAGSENINQSQRLSLA